MCPKEGAIELSVTLRGGALLPQICFFFVPDSGSHGNDKKG